MFAQDSMHATGRRPLPPLRAGEGWGGVRRAKLASSCAGMGLRDDELFRKRASPHPNPPLLHVGEGADLASKSFLGQQRAFAGMTTRFESHRYELLYLRHPNQKQWGYLSTIWLRPRCA